MPEKVDPSWKRLFVRELKDFYTHDPKEYGLEETRSVVALVHLVEMGKVRAFQKPTGEILYQADTTEIDRLYE